ncbi:MAG: serine/threonine protein kinase [Acidobacteriota bacterium]
MRQLALENSIVDDRYEVIRCLGRGSYAEIFLAHDQARRDERVIIKALNTSLQGTIDAELERTLVENFQNEAVALDKVRHPNIIRRLGHGTAADLNGVPFHYLVLEYMPGGDLLSLCRNRSLDLEDALFYFQQVAEALACAHSRQVIHRDIKPNNLLLSEDRRTVKIADFGVAKITTDDSDEITRVGTNVYAPPEHHPDSSTDALNQKLTPSADVYSLAKTIYTAMTGRAPRQFSRSPIAELPAEIMEKPWGAGLLAMLRKATANQTANRYQSIQEFWEEFARLDHFLESSIDPEATLVRSRLRTNVAVEQATAQPSFQAYQSDTRPRGARIIVELPQRNAQHNVKDTVISNGNAAGVAVAPQVVEQGKKDVADLNAKQTHVVRDGRNALERAGIKAEWLRVAFIILLVFALMGIVASTYFHFAEPSFREGVISEAPNVNLRSEPGGNVVMVLPEGTRLRVYEERSGWARVRVVELPDAQAVNATIEGWVSIRFIK